MRKKEFLEVLRISLSEEVSSLILEQNIKYYDEYIGTRALEEEEKILRELGDPRLIAKTIIASERIAKEKSTFTGNQNHRDYYEGQDQETRNEQNNVGNGYRMLIKWYHKIMIGIVIIMILFIVGLLGRILLSMLFAFGIPILLILFILALFRKR